MVGSGYFELFIFAVSRIRTYFLSWGSDFFFAGGRISNKFFFAVVRIILFCFWLKGLIQINFFGSDLSFSWRSDPDLFSCWGSDLDPFFAGDQIRNYLLAGGQIYFLLRVGSGLIFLLGVCS